MPKNLIIYGKGKGFDPKAAEQEEDDQGRSVIRDDFGNVRNNLDTDDEPESDDEILTAIGTPVQTQPVRAQKVRRGRIVGHIPEALLSASSDLIYGRPPNIKAPTKMKARAEIKKFKLALKKFEKDIKTYESTGRQFNSLDDQFDYEQLQHNAAVFRENIKSLENQLKDENLPER